MLVLFCMEAGVSAKPGQALAWECDEGGPPSVASSELSSRAGLEGGPLHMLHVGLDLSRRRVDVCLISDEGELVGQFPRPLIVMACMG